MVSAARYLLTYGLALTFLVVAFIKLYAQLWVEGGVYFGLSVALVLSEYYRVVVRPKKEIRRELFKTLRSLGFQPLEIRSTRKALQSLIARCHIFTGASPQVMDLHILGNSSRTTYFGRYMMGSDLSQGYFFTVEGDKPLAGVRALRQANLGAVHVQDIWKVHGLQLDDLHNLPADLQGVWLEVPFINFESIDNYLVVDYLGYRDDFRATFPIQETMIRNLLHFTQTFIANLGAGS